MSCSFSFPFFFLSFFLAMLYPFFHSYRLDGYLIGSLLRTNGYDGNVIHDQFFAQGRAMERAFPTR